MEANLIRNEILDTLKTRSEEMKHHRLFGLVKTLDDLRFFMTWHVFAVWDFMSLTKRLQHEFTTVRVPWFPPVSPHAARLVNEIVLGEESDETPHGNHCSHYELYLAAMEEIGAGTAQIRRFTEMVGANMPLDIALNVVGAPIPVRRFVNFTVTLAANGRTEEVLGSFLYGREDAIPDMFTTLLHAWGVDPATVPTLVFYLNRHIQIDGDSHGPAAVRLMHEYVGDNDDVLRSLLGSAIASIEQRIDFWNALAEALATPERRRSNAATAAVSGV